MRNYIKEFLDTKSIESGVSPNTIMAYRRDLTEFFDILESKDLSLITEEDIDFYLLNLNKLNNSAKSFFKLSRNRRYMQCSQSRNHPIIKANGCNDKAHLFLRFKSNRISIFTRKFYKF